MNDYTGFAGKPKNIPDTVKEILDRANKGSVLREMLEDVENIGDMVIVYGTIKDKGVTMVSFGNNCKLVGMIEMCKLELLDEMAE